MYLPALRALAATLIGCAALSPTMAQTSAPATPDDPYLWMEDVASERALGWVRERNAATRPLLEAHPDFKANRDRFKAIMDSKERIPYVTRRGAHFYNFWQDAEHPRGLWRRTSLEGYRAAQPEWDVLLDLDALAKAEGENWVWKGAACLPGASSRCLLQLSRGGADAVVVREYDLAGRRFVADGFQLPEAKSQVDWLDEQRVLVGTDTGPGSMTDSGYPRVIRLWTRGQPLSAAVTVYEARQTDVSAFATVDHTPGFERVQLGRSPDFYTQEVSLWTAGPAGSAGTLKALDKPLDAQLGFWREWVLVELRSDWTTGGRTWPRG